MSDDSDRNITRFHSHALAVIQSDRENAEQSLAEFGFLFNSQAFERVVATVFAEKCGSRKIHIADGLRTYADYEPNTRKAVAQSVYEKLCPLIVPTPEQAHLEPVLRKNFGFASAEAFSTFRKAAGHALQQREQVITAIEARLDELRPAADAIAAVAPAHLARPNSWLGALASKHLGATMVLSAATGASAASAAWLMHSPGAGPTDVFDVSRVLRRERISPQLKGLAQFTQLEKRNAAIAAYVRDAERLWPDEVAFIARNGGSKDLAIRALDKVNTFFDKELGELVQTFDALAAKSDTLDRRSAMTALATYAHNLQTFSDASTPVGVHYEVELAQLGTKLVFRDLREEKTYVLPLSGRIAAASWRRANPDDRRATKDILMIKQGSSTSLIVFPEDRPPFITTEAAGSKRTELVPSQAPTDAHGWRSL